MFQITQSKNLTALAASPSSFLKHSLKLLGCAVFTVVSSLPLSVKAEPPGGTAGWTKTFEDTFSSSFDTNKWNKTFWWGDGNINDGSVSYYSANNVSVAGGYMTLKANNNSEGGKSYTGAIATTYGKFYQTYGYFEARVKISKGMGVDPYFSLSPEDTSWPPEINIFEIPGFLGQNATKDWMFNHYIDANGNHAFTTATWTSPVGLDQDYHTYGILWQPGLLVWYLDGVELSRTTVGVPNKDCYLAFGHRVGDPDGTWTGSPANTTFPQYMSVKSVQVWKRTDGKVGTIAIKANANNKYVTAENAGAAPLIANRDWTRLWETFDVYDAGGNGKVALKSQANGQYVTAENGGASSLIANRTAVGPWETFQLSDQNGGTVSLTAQANNQYVTADSNGGSPLIANRTAVGPWEKFFLIGQ